MKTLCDSWLAQSPRFRLICCCGWMLGLLIVVMLCLSTTAQKRVRQQEALNQQRAAIQAQWRNLYLLAASPEKPEEMLIPFSPLLFQTPLARLIHWQPSAQGGEMTLKPDWDAIPPMFDQLAEQGMNVSRFSLCAEGAELLLTLQLERLNDG
ncbi:HofO family protein [Citrobacter sp.]|uniref:HofO family protein n=1 Tax=Citrobacter sp. TaxID=1896336 RepID=UPI002FC9EDA6